MDHPPTTLDTYREAELLRASDVIANASTADTAAGRLHYEGWRRRYQISSAERHLAELLPAGTLIQERSGKYRIGHYYERENARGETLRNVWFKDLIPSTHNPDHPGTPPNTLDYPITVVDTP